MLPLTGPLQALAMAAALSVLFLPILFLVQLAGISLWTKAEKLLKRRGSAPTEWHIPSEGLLHVYWRFR